ncbi:MAG: three-Cys-motif partner protein TcmP [Rhizobiaceae bacterium]
MPQRSFGNKGTVVKLKTVFDYASFYTTALKGTSLRLHYLDAFAGSGQIPLRDDAPLLDGVIEVDELIEGSARKALSIPYPFDRYVFSDLKESNTQELLRLRTTFPKLSDRIEIKTGDARDIVESFCSRLGSHDRALVLLDPFGNQVGWQTLVTLAETEKVDLWYLFPAWMGVARQVKSTGEILADAAQSIDAMFGPHDWRTQVVQSKEALQSDMFEQTAEETEKIATADSITRFMIDCMSGIFKGGVSQKWLPLGRNGRHFYSLLFACANPSAKAKGLAQRVAKDIMTRN